MSNRCANVLSFLFVIMVILIFRILIFVVLFVSLTKINPFSSKVIFVVVVVDKNTAQHAKTGRHSQTANHPHARRPLAFWVRELHLWPFAPIQSVPDQPSSNHHAYQIWWLYSFRQLRCRETYIHTYRRADIQTARIVFCVFYYMLPLA